MSTSEEGVATLDPRFMIVPQPATEMEPELEPLKGEGLELTGVRSTLFQLDHAADVTGNHSPVFSGNIESV